MRLSVLVPFLLLAGCVSLPEARSVSCEAAPRPEISVSEGGRTASMHLDVLTYNIEGLPKLTRSGRRDPLQEIGDRLAELRRAGTAPDVVMFQEVFSRRARNAVLSTGYPSLAPGPSAGDRPPRSPDPRLPGRKNPRRGELGLKLSSSGVLIASEYPFVATTVLPYARGSCAGIDCLANKGVALARMAIPGVPGFVDLYSTHMNSMGASRVPERRHLAAHRRQARELSDWIAANSPPGMPVILAGDFNMRQSPGRFEHFGVERLELVHAYCIANREACDVRLSWDGDEPWMDTQDLQLFASGSPVRVRPVRVEAMFDGSERGPRLSDHDALRVVYELSWPTDVSQPASACPALPLKNGRNPG